MGQINIVLQHNHNILPIFDKNSQVLILGSFPSPMSRKEKMYYANPRNRMWNVLVTLFNEKVPKNKHKFLLNHNIAMWDVLKSCKIKGASDSTIANEVPNNIESILVNTNIKLIITAGATATKLYKKYNKIDIKTLALPSTSPANASYSLEKLIDKYKVILNYVNTDVKSMQQSVNNLKNNASKIRLLDKNKNLFYETEQFIDFKKIALSGQCFRAKIIDKNNFFFINKQKIIRIKKHDSQTYIANWDKSWIEYFDLYRTYPRKNIPNKFLRKTAEYSNGIKILKQDPWECLVSFIISQRKSIPAIMTCIELLSLNFGSEISENIYSFPTPQQLVNAKDKILEKCKLGYRLNYVKNAAEKVYCGDINLELMKKLDTNSLLEQLQKIYGVGKKIANCVALFGFGRTECVPIDTWINKIIDNQFNGKNLFYNYGEYAGILQQYAFYYMISN